MNSEVFPRDMSNSNVVVEKATFPFHTSSKDTSGIVRHVVKDMLKICKSRAKKHRLHFGGEKSETYFTLPRNQFVVVHADLFERKGCEGLEAWVKIYFGTRMLAAARFEFSIKH